MATTLPVLSIAPCTATEGNSGSYRFKFTVSRSERYADSYVSWKVTGITASAADFAAGVLPSGTLHMPSGNLSMDIWIDVAGDYLVEGNETFKVTLFGASGATIGTATAIGTIIDNDRTPLLRIAATSATKNEGDVGTTPFTFTITRSDNTGLVSTVNWSVGGGTATAADFAGGVLPGGSLVFGAGESSKTITVNVAGDRLVEVNKTFNVNLSGATNASIAVASATGTILNDDILPTLSIAATNANRYEGNSGATPFTFTVTRAGNTAYASTVGWNVTGADVTGADFTGGVLPGGTLSFAAGETSKTITVNVAGDALVERDEGFTVVLSGPTGATLASASAIGVIRNDDALPTLAIAATTTSKAEGNAGTTPFTFTVTRTGNTGIVSYANWSISGGTATAADFTGSILPAGSVSFGVGETSKTITVNVAGDSAVESDETFKVSLSAVTGAVLGTATATATIINDDTLPTLSISASGATKSEGNAGVTPFTFTITRSGNLGVDSAALWRVGNISTNALDFAGGSLPSGTIGFSPGESSKTITVNVAGDLLVEANETFSVTLSSVTGATLGTASATGTILNDDTLPVIAIAATSASKNEGNSGATPFTFTVTRSGNTGIASSINWSVANGTTTAADFTGSTLPTGSLSFAVGETSKTITVNVAGDTAVESNETFTVNLASPNGATLGTASATGTILNDDTLPVVAIAAASASRNEGNAGTTPFTFTVTRSGNTGIASSINWSVANGTTTAADFTGGTLPTGSLSFAVGETSKTITVNVAGDTAVESNETFTVNLASPNGATLGTASATGTILNDDVSTVRPGIDASIAKAASINLLSSVDDSIENLVSTTKWGGAVGAGVSLTYSFSTANSVFTYANTFDGITAHTPYTALSSTQQAAAIRAMSAVSSFCNVTFTQVGDTTTSAGDIRWTLTQSPAERTANGWYPSSSAVGGDIWIGSGGYTNPNLGTYDYQTFTHELGHALGLDHPHNGSPAPEPGEDQLKYSVMSYCSYDGATPGNGYSGSYYPTSYMLNDIAALQYVYGANTSYNTGNDVYSWVAGSSVFQCIWDAGGTDTLDASNQTQGCSLNLNAGSWSSIGSSFYNGQSNVRDDLAIAYGVTIENARGSAFADTLIGNAVANRLIGGGGADTLTGGAGADQFLFTVVGDGGDTITDFSSADGDKLQVIAANFGLTAGGTALLRTGSSLPGAIGPAGQFLYNTTSGQLWFDRDGAGTGAAVQLATLANRPNLTASDIQLVSA